MTESGNRRTVKARFADAALKAAGGWRFSTPLPMVRKAVCLAVPHTHNLDGLLLVLMTQSVGLSVSWMVKDTWSKPPGIGHMVRGAGGVGIDRSKAGGMVNSMIEAFESSDELYLVIPPEGTRSYTECWKSGFYRIALGAKVPVIPAFLDYENKRGGFYDPIDLTGDVKTDMDAIRHVYRDAVPMARHREKFGPIRLRSEM
ncbi:MAG: 1-acyl-sn-glycerol-3-phosphate acyltransferase [Nannocystaceae bacterium]|nr:1-acyl-sn-glycerol-3-phosphate acyltransferase [Nannocystaceae bacterium]